MFNHILKYNVYIIGTLLSKNAVIVNNTQIKFE